MDLEKARQLVEYNKRKGIDCPCCGQFYKVYKRKLNSSMARALIAIYNEASNRPREWLYIPSFLSDHKLNANTALLRYWNLIEPMESANLKTNLTRGMWKITGTGIAFVEGKIRVLKYGLFCNQKFLGFDGTETTSIEESLGDHFNLEELLVA